ncbi:MAG: DMT family transporter, partial [Anaerolineae bacterium]|nr:DMT family transporter [Anaerolineae bacterium]
LNGPTRLSSSDWLQPNKAMPRNLPFVLAMGILSISASAILIRYAQGDGVPSLLIAAGRLVIAVIILTPIVFARYSSHIRNLSQRDLLLAMTAGFFLAIHFAAWVTSLEYTSVLVSVVIVTTSPIWVALLEFFFLRSIPRPGVIAGLIIAIVGGLVLGMSGGADSTTENVVNGEIIGGGLSLIGAITVAIYLVIGRSLRNRLPVIPYIWLVYGCASILLSIVVIVTQTPITGYAPTAYILLIAMAIFPQLLGHSSLNYAVGYLPATFVSLITQLEPIGSALLALILFAEVPTGTQIIGSLIILVGVTIATFTRSNRPLKTKRVNPL